MEIENNTNSQDASMQPGIGRISRCKNLCTISTVIRVKLHAQSFSNTYCKQICLMICDNKILKKCERNCEQGLSQIILTINQSTQCNHGCEVIHILTFMTLTESIFKC